MKLVSWEHAEKHENSAHCKVYEYELNDPDINFGIALIDGQYPEEGYCYNEVCKELIYVISGSGTLHFNSGEKVVLKAKDTILIEPNEAYYWEGNLVVALPCTPAWYPEQHRVIHGVRKEF